MRDDEKANKYLKILGIRKAMALYKESGEEAIYAGAVVSYWKDKKIEEGLKKKKKPADIAKRMGVHIKRVTRRRNRLFGFKSKKRIPPK